MTNRWAILALIMAAQTMANVGPLGIPSIAPLIREDLGLSMAQAGSFISAYYVGPSLISLPAGWMADRWGVRLSMAGGQALIAIGLVSVAGSHAFTPLVVLMIIAGAGYGILNPTTTKAGKRLGGFAIPWVGLGLAMVATLCLLIPVREGRMETP